MAGETAIEKPSRGAERMAGSRHPLPLERASTQPLSWRPDRLAARLATVGLAGALVGIVLGHGGPLVVAAGSLVMLAALVHMPRPDTVDVTVVLDDDRCFEGGTVTLTVTVRAPRRLGQVTVSVEAPDDVELRDPPVHLLYDARETTRSWRLCPRHWGLRQAGPVRLRCRSVGGAWIAETVVEAPPLLVFPPPARARDTAVPPRLLARIGAHVGRRPGSGTEFVNIRDYAPGDRVRRVNWPVSSRRRSLMVNEYAEQHAADVVAFIDTISDTGAEGAGSLDRAIRGAAGVVQAYLRQGDRAGLVTFGGRVRWLAPGSGTRQYYRILEHVLRARVEESYVQPELARLPVRALPPRALVFVFSPLTERRALDAVTGLVERGHPVVVVDVLGTEPAAGRDALDQLALRIWRLDRAAVVYRLGELGVPVLTWEWDHGVSLDALRVSGALRGVR